MGYEKRIIGREIFNPVSTVKSPGGMKQYRIAPSCELAGKSLAFYGDGLKPVYIRFDNAENLMWAHQGEAFRWETYEAAKAEENLFLIRFRLSDRELPTLATLVWDTLTHLVTCVISVLGTDAKHPRLVDTKVYFGAEKLPHTPLTEERHAYTEELVGKRMIWRYNPNDEVMHCYCGKDWFRLGDSEKVLAPDASEEEKAHYRKFLDRRSIYPVYEEPAFYIKLRDGFYLYSVTEKNINRVLPEQGGNNLLIVLNAYRCRYVGRTFGVGPDGNVENELIGAIGYFSETPDKVEAIPYPIYTEVDDR